MLALAFLACLRCSTAVVLLASHVLKPLSMKEHPLARSSAVCSKVSVWTPNAFENISKSVCEALL